jgi:hypothetical protein
MTTFVASSSHHWLCKEWDYIIDSTEKMREDERVSNQSDPETYLKYLYKEYYIKKILLYLENEIVRHEKYLEIGHHPFFFSTDEELQVYIDGCKVEYPIYRKKVEQALGDDFKVSYKEAKGEWNKKSLEYLERTKWTQCDTVNFILPRFYKSGKHAVLKDKDWDYKSSRYREE